MDEDNKYLIDINKDNLARVIAFAGIYDGKANFVLTIILALTAYLMAELPSYIDLHAKHPTNAWFVVVDLFAISCLGLFVWATIFIVLTIRPDVRSIPGDCSAAQPSTRLTRSLQSTRVAAMRLELFAT